MKLSVKILVIVLCLATLLCGLSVFASDGAAQGEWRTDADGKERYYVNGAHVTGNHKVGSHTFTFAEDGEYLGVYDAYVAPGSPGVMDTELYKTAVASKDPWIKETFSSTSFKYAIPTTVRAGYREAYDRGNGNLAYTFRHHQDPQAFVLSQPSDGSTHSYMNKKEVAAFEKDVSGEIVIEFDLGLFALPPANSNVITVFDRSNGGSGDEKFPKNDMDSISLLNVNTEGYVFSPAKSDYLICKLKGDTLTRLSVSIHRSSNTFDIYCNGILALENLPFYTNGVQTVEEFEINECRMLQVNAGKNATVPHATQFVIDNLYFYGASEPVCLDASQPKEGFCEDGGYLRYYDNGAIRTGTFAVTGEFFGQKLENYYVTFEGKTGRAYIGNKATVMNGGVVVSSEAPFGGLYETPKAIDMDGKKFVGWNIGGKLFEEGFSMRISSDVTVEATGIGFSLVNGAAMSTEKDASELIFAAKISKADYAAITALGATVEPHIVTVPTENLRAAYGYISPEHLTIEGLDAPVDTVATDWLDENDNYYFYGAQISDITDITREYSAVAYLRITLPNGNVMDVYADYSEENNSRTLYNVALSAYNDRTTVRVKGAYTKLVAFDGIRTYSPYGMIKRGRIKDVLDSIVAVNVKNSSVESSGDFYDAPYKLSYEPSDTGYNVTLASSFGWKPEKIKGVMVDGELLSAESYTVSGDGLTFPVESDKIFIYEAPKEVVPEGVSSWTYISSATDTGLFTGTVELPAVASDGSVIEHSSQSRLYKWSYKTKLKLPLTQADAFASTKKGIYYDLSVWKALRFSVYVPEDFKGATFYMKFVSENNETSHQDYFGYMVTLSDSGWNDVVVNKVDFTVSESPLSWDRITAVELDTASSTPSAGSQNNSSSTVLYISDIIAYDHKLNATVKNTVDEYSKEKGAAIFALGGYAGSVDGKTYKINPYNTDTVVFKEGDVVYLPVNVFAVSLDSGAAYYEKSGAVTYVYDDTKYTFTPGNTYKEGAEYHELTYPAIHRDGGLFISAQDAMAIYEYENMYEDRMGLVILSNNEIELNLAEEQSTIYEYIKDIMYVRPSGDTIYRDLMEYSGGQHPHIMIDADGFAELRYYLKNEKTLQEYVASTKASYGIGSAKFNAQPQWFRRTDGKRLLSISRDYKNKIMAWGLLYQLGVYEGEEKQQLIDRVWTEAEAVANFYDDENSKYSWNPGHYLDTGEAAYGMALAYDWFYDEWSPEQRSQLAKSIYDYGMNTTKYVDGGGYYRSIANTNNWGGVCNGGIMSSALAIVNDAYIVGNGLQDEVIQVIESSMLAVEAGMWVYGPDGGYEEGPGYWGYGTNYVMIFLAALNSSCGSNYGIYHTPGFAQSAYFTTYLGNANTTWGFHDGGSGDMNPEIAPWFAKVANDGNLNAIRRQGIEKGWTSSTVFDIMFFDPHIISNSINLSLDAYYSLDTVMTFRSSWDASNNIFAGLHGGDNAAGHGDLDIGNFVINVNGVFMINDLGSDTYNMAGYFGSQRRWSYYRKRTEGQNCLVMIGHGESWNDKTGRPEYYVDANDNVVKDANKAKYVVSEGKKYTLTASKGIGELVGSVSAGTPDLPNPAYYGQKKEAIAKATAFESGVNSAYGVVDMAPAYTVSKGQMLRGLYMTNNRSTVVIQDEGVFSADQDIWWFAHTSGKITVSEDGRSAIISYSGIYLYAEIVVDPADPMDAKFSVMGWQSLDENYVGDSVAGGKMSSDTEKSRSGQKLVITATDTKKFRCAVAFRQISSPEEAPEIGTTYTWTPIKDWKAE